MGKKNWQNELPESQSNQYCTYISGDKRIMEKGPVLFEKKDGKGIITIDRPKVLNALDWDTFFKFQAGLEDMIADDDVRVIFFT